MPLSLTMSFSVVTIQSAFPAFASFNDVFYVVFFIGIMVAVFFKALEIAAC